MSYQIKIPSCIYGGEGCIENIKGIIEKENAKLIKEISEQIRIGIKPGHIQINGRCDASNSAFNG